MSLTPAKLRKRSHSSAEPRRSADSAEAPSTTTESDAKGMWTDSVATITGNIKSTLVQRLEENHLKQAFYYSAANVILVFLSATGIALWFVFQEFIEPLFWAVLCGALLHPIKTKWINATDEWLRGISRSNIPLFVGISILLLSVPGNLFRFLTKVGIPSFSPRKYLDIFNLPNYWTSALITNILSISVDNRTHSYSRCDSCVPCRGRHGGITNAS